MDFFADRRWGWKMITRYVESSLIGGITYRYDLSIGARVRVRTLLHETFGLVVPFAKGFYVAALFSYDVVTGLITFYKRRTKALNLSPGIERRSRSDKTQVFR